METQRVTVNGQKKKKSPFTRHLSSLCVIKKKTNRFVLAPPSATMWHKAKNKNTNAKTRWVIIAQHEMFIVMENMCYSLKVEKQVHKAN